MLMLMIDFRHYAMLTLSRFAFAYFRRFGRAMLIFFSSFYFHDAD